VSHILLGVFTLGIGNTIYSAIVNAMLIIRGTIAIIKAAIAVGKAVKLILTGEHEKI